MKSLILTFGVMCVSSAYATPDTFWQTWSDGRAEVSGYSLSVNRYGQQRQGQAILIFVTEPFSISKQVKVDRYDAANPDHTIALKLNLIKRFRTGVYDYALMTSVFTIPQEAFRTIKGTFSSQEWCGQVFENLSNTRGQGRLQVDSYFEGESGVQTFNEAVELEDALWIQARGLASGGPGHTMLTTRRIRSAAHRRLNHQSAVLSPLKTSWSGPHTYQVPMGSLRVRTIRWQRTPNIECALHIEVSVPHRIVGWTCSDGEDARLTGSQRMPYWNQARLGDERLLRGLGLPNLGAPHRTPESK